KNSGFEYKYNWQRYYETVRALQPDAVICDCGPDIRWVGHNGGVARKEEWSVVPYTLLNNAPVSRLVEPDLGSLKKLKKVKELVWYPPITYIPLRRGFYYHKQDETNLKMLSNILDVYFRSVGNNGVFVLCIAPTFLGDIDEKDVTSLRTLGAQLKVEFKDNLATEGTFSSDNEKDEAHSAKALNDENGYWHSGDISKNISITLDMGKVHFINKIVLGENIKTGQQIEKFTLSYFFDGKWRKIYSGNTVGRKKICLIAPTNARRIRLDIKETRGFATLKTFEVY
ncbi:MAG: discoidin domain-containing protein, partial [Clostridia bacterium]|nr:discoidin domain-containing protein [Clostridia bacterium]